MTLNPLVSLLLMLGLAACDRQEDQVIERDGEPSVHMVNDDDPEMRDAIVAARRTIDGFIERIASPVAGQSYASIKIPLREGDQVEHIWIAEPTFDGEQFAGRLSNAPVFLTSVAEGDSVSVSRDSISDWMVVVGDTVYGGYSVHLIRSRMSDAEQRAFDAAQRLVFPDQPRGFVENPAQ